MTARDRRPLALVVDNDTEYRENVVSKRLEAIGARCLRARDIQEACRFAEAQLDNVEKINLVVLEMQLPVSEQQNELDPEAGLHLLNAFRDLRLIEDNCKIIVFTCYQSDQNCVDAVNAGATGYVAKHEQTDSEGRTTGGIDALTSLCHELLTGEREREAVQPPDDQWMKTNKAWLVKSYAGKWVAFIEAEAAKDVGIHADERDGLVLLDGDSYPEMRHAIINSPILLRLLPTTVLVARTEEEPPDNFDD